MTLIDYVSRREGGKGLTSIEGNVDASIQRLEGYMQNLGGKLITTTRNNTDNMRTNRKITNRKQKWEEKQLYGHYNRLISDISHKKTQTWLRKGNLQRETESLQITA